MADDNVLIKLLADAKGLLDGVAQSGEALDTLADFADKAADALSLIGIVTGVAKMAGEIVDMTRRAGEAAERIELLRSVTDLSAQTQQEWGFAFQSAGGNIEDLGVAMRTLSQNLVQADDTGSDAAQTFRQLGLDATQLRGNTEGAFRAIIDKLAAMPAGFERTNLASQLLGRGVANILPVLADGTEGLDRMGRRAHELGAVLGDRMLSDLRKADDAFDELDLATDSVGKRIGAHFAPLVEAAARALANLAGLAGRAFSALSQAGDVLVARFMGVVQVIGAVVESLATFDIATKGGIDRLKQKIQAIDEETSWIIKSTQAMDQATTATTRHTAATAGNSAALKKASDDYKLYIEGLTKMGEEELKRRAMIERARVASGGPQVERGLKIVQDTLAQLKMEESRFWDEVIRESGTFEPLRGQSSEQDPFGFQKTIDRAASASTSQWDKGRAIVEASIAEFKRAQDEMFRVSDEGLDPMRPLKEAPDFVQEEIGRRIMFGTLEQVHEWEAAEDETRTSIARINAQWDETAVLQYQRAKADGALMQDLWQSVATGVDRAALGVILGTTKLNDAIKNSAQSVAVQLGGDFIGAVAKGNAALASTLGPWAALAGGLALMVNRSDKMQAAFDRLGTALEPIWNLFGRIGDALAPLIELVARFFEALKPLIDILAILLELGLKLNPMFVLLEVSLRPIVAVLDLLKPALEAFADAIQTITDLIPGFGGSGGGPLDVVTGGSGGGGFNPIDVVTAPFEAIGDFFGFADGGILKQPIFAAGEAGPEAIIPLNEQGAGFMRDVLGGGGTTINVYVTGTLYGSIRDLAAALKAPLDRVRVVTT